MGIEFPLPSIGFGCEQLGGYAWGEVSNSEIVEAIHTGLDRGVRLFDTADVYGRGESESALGKALEGRRHQALLLTKGGVRLDDAGRAFYDNSAAWLRKALEASLKRLRSDYVDVYVLHYRDNVTPWETVFETLDSLVSAGKIRSYGFSNLNHGSPPSSFPALAKLIQAEFSLANRSQETVMQALLQRGKGLRPMFYGCLGQGILTGKYRGPDGLHPNDRRNHPRYANFHGDRLERNLRIVERLRVLSAELGRPAAQIALRWILDYWPDAILLAGIKRKSQLDDLLQCLEWRLENEIVQELAALSASPPAGSRADEASI